MTQTNLALKPIMAEPLPDCQHKRLVELEELEYQCKDCGQLGTPDELFEDNPGIAKALKGQCDYMQRERGRKWAKLG